MRKARSWKTTLTGVAMILAAIAQVTGALLDDDPKTTVNIEATLAAIAGGVGLIAARDNDVTSEQAGAKP